MLAPEQLLKMQKDKVRQQTFSTVVSPCRAVDWPVEKAPWPRQPKDGSQPIRKEDIKTMPGSKMRQMMADTRQKSGPMIGAGDACRHQDSKYFDRLLLWPMQHKRNYELARKRSAPEAVEHRKLKAAEEKINRIVAIADSHDPIEAAHAAEVARLDADQPRRRDDVQHADTGTADTQNKTRDDKTEGVARNDHETRLAAMTYDFFCEEYRPAVLAVWQAQKRRVGRAGGVEPLLAAVWASLPPSKAELFISKARNLLREEDAFLMN